MQKRQWRSIWLRSMPPKDHRRSSFLIATMIGLLLALFLIHSVNTALRPQLVAFAEAQVQNHLTLISTQAVNHAVSDQAFGYTDLVILQTEQGGEVSTMSVDISRINLLRSQIMEEITKQILTLDSQDLGIPLGLLSGIDILSAVGPKLPVRITSVASATGLFRNEFIDAGINQTLHRIILDVTINAKLLLLVGVIETQVTIPVCITEAVVIGQVPQTYFNWNQ